MSIIEKIYKSLDLKKDEMIKIRRFLHQNPELSFNEKNTSKFIENFYKDLNVNVETNIGGYGIKVTIDTKKPGKTVALRADFDALPINEETNLSFKSKNKNVMHACGHDAHTAYLLVLAKILSEYKNDLNGKIIIIHQPAEETPPGGALSMINDGVLNGVDNVFGIHFMNQMETGNVYYHKKESQQSRDKFEVKIIGKGGHGSMPHEAIDPVVCASFLVNALQTIVSRRISPFDNAVITIGSFDGKGTFNIIKDQVTITGDVRCMNERTRSFIEEEVKRMSINICKAFNCKVKISYTNDYPILYNDEKMTDIVIEALKDLPFKELLGLKDSGPQAPSEDFAYYAKEVPSVFYYVGAAKEKNNFPHHHPKFDINEDSLLIAAKSLATVVLKYMEII
ncbi:M20 family metallopeptidase [Mycoplasma elephantis]|uniref:M20 family metallopeptidase n=1 Tax=Mycoplasma elephantis TaxID=114882 RepID=UPI00055A1499|nr:M20 family metallopeptidase [Mycoplasma elephantis]